MNYMTKMKLVTSSRQHTVNPTVARRNKLAEKIAQQYELATAKNEGRVYAPKFQKKIKNAETGECSTIEAVKRVKEWFWTSETGKINLSLRYGSKVLDLAKGGKNAIEFATADELIAGLLLLKEAVIAGELDEAIGKASDKLRAGFAK